MLPFAQEKTPHWPGSRCGVSRFPFLPATLFESDSHAAPAPAAIQRQQQVDYDYRVAGHAGNVITTAKSLSINVAAPDRVAWRKLSDRIRSTGAASNVTSESPAPALPLFLVSPNDFPSWRDARSAAQRAFLAAQDFRPERGRATLLPGDDGAPVAAVAGVGASGVAGDPWLGAAIAERLPPGTYAIAEPVAGLDATRFAIAWRLAQYRYSRYRNAPGRVVVLNAPEADAAYVEAAVEAVCLAHERFTPVAGRDRLGRCREFLRPEIVRGRVDEIAREAHRLDRRLDVGRVGLGRVQDHDAPWRIAVPRIAVL
ncbi:hypothetical protein EON77_11125, partial [bacterium]